MSEEWARIISVEYDLPGSCRDIMVKSIKSLNRAERKIYFRDIRPLESKIRRYIRDTYDGLDEEGKKSIVKSTVDSLLAAGGQPDLCDSMFMDAVGRIKIYRILRERSENEGVRLNPLSSFGGFSLVILLVVVITALVLYLRNI